MHGIARTKAAWDDHMRKAAQQEGIPDSYRPIIMYLKRCPGASQKSIAEFLNVTTSAVNQTVKSMIDDDYLEKQPDPADGRSFKLFLTEHGEEIAGRLRKRLQHSDDEITEFIGAEREAELMQLLHELTDYIRKELN